MTFDFTNLQKDTETKMQQSIASFESEIAKIRTGRANPALLDGVMVEAYGDKMRLDQLASIAPEDNRTLIINAWDKSLIPHIEKAILASNLGLNPATAGTSIRLGLPVLTQETRKDYVKQVQALTEKARVAIRNIRREAIQSLKKSSDGISEDDVRHHEQKIQKTTDSWIHKAELICSQKEKELLEF